MTHTGIAWCSCPGEELNPSLPNPGWGSFILLPMEAVLRGPIANKTFEQPIELFEHAYIAADVKKKSVQQATFYLPNHLNCTPIKISKTHWGPAGFPVTEYVVWPRLYSHKNCLMST